MQNEGTRNWVMTGCWSRVGSNFMCMSPLRTRTGKRVYKDANGEEVKAPNGWYDPATGHIHIDLNAGMDGKGTMLFTVAHELTHFIRQWSPAKFKVLANFLFDYYGYKGQRVSKLVEAQIAKAKDNGRKISFDTAYEEVVADSMESILADGNVVQIMADMKQQDKTLWQKIVDWFKDLAEDLKKLVAAYKDLKPDSVEGKMVADMNDMIAVFESMYAEALVDAGENYLTSEGNKKTTQEGGVKYMARASRKEVVHIKDVIKASSVALNSMNPVATITTEDLTKMNTNQRYKWAVSILKATGFRVDRQNFGVINFSEKQINSGLNYLNTSGEVAAFATLPQVLKRGIIIYDDNNHKGRNFGTVVIAAPVEINGVRGNMGVALQRTSATHYHTHRILMPDGSAFEFKINAALTPSGGFDKMSIIAPAISTASNGKVPQQKPGVNPKSVEKRSDRSLPETKEKFSLREPVERTRNLVALHNLTADKLAKTLELGGFPMPSIVITKADIPHTNFGDITLVLGRETVDPKVDKKNVVYSADAWTPVFPRTEYEENQDVGNAIARRLRGLEKKVDDHFRDDLRRVYMDIEGILNRYDGEEGIIQYAMDNYGLKATYCRGPHPLFR